MVVELKKFTYWWYHIPSGKRGMNTQAFVSRREFEKNLDKWNKSNPEEWYYRDTIIGDIAMAVANARQIGGDHYENEYQHWDWVTDIGMGYLGSNATKYVTRWRKKNGKQDLYKSLHYIDKLIEVAALDLAHQNRPPIAFIKVQTEKFVTLNKLDYNEKMVCYLIAGYENVQTLRNARTHVEALIDMKIIADGGDFSEAKPVPAEDSNKHAERVDGEAKNIPDQDPNSGA